MKAAPLILSCALVSAAAGALAGRLAPSTAAPTSNAAEESALAQRLEELEADRDELRTELAAVRAQAETELTVPGPERVALDDRESDLDELEGRLRTLIEQAENGLSPLDAPAAERNELDVLALAEELLDPDLTGPQVNAIWEELRRTGRIDGVVAWFRERAESNPEDPDAQSELGEAYLQQLFGSNDMMSQGRYATLADGAFDRALALDDQHWDARFQKAISLSFWPPALGKQSAAIQQFETLIGQQSTQPIQPHFAQSYLFLGNMHSQMGNMDKALQVWNQGLESHPDHAELLAQIAAAQGK